MTIRLTFGELLERRGLSPDRLYRSGRGLSRNTLYALANPPADRVRVDLDVLAAAMRAVEAETGEPVTLADVLEVVPDPTPAPPAEAAGRLNLTPELERLLHEARATLKPRPGRPLGPGEPFGSEEPAELEGEGPSSSELVSLMRSGKR